MEFFIFKSDALSSSEHGSKDEDRDVFSVVSPDVQIETKLKKSKSKVRKTENSKKPEKDPNAPKRAKSSYMFFLDFYRPSKCIC